MEIQINTYDDLLQFIDRDDITAKQCLEVSCSFLKVIDITFDDELNIENVRSDVKAYVKNWCHEGTFERPIFLFQTEDEFSIKEAVRPTPRNK